MRDKLDKKISGFMSAKVITAKPTDGARETFFNMRAQGVRHLPVVDEDGKLVGIISDRDLRRPDWVDEDRDISHVYKLDDDIEVRHLMTPNVMTVRTFHRISRAVDIFLEHRFGALPVLNKEGSVVGILSAMDLLRALQLILAESRKG